MHDKTRPTAHFDAHATRPEQELDHAAFAQDLQCGSEGITHRHELAAVDHAVDIAVIDDGVDVVPSCGFSSRPRA